ncbi:MAG: CotH kinase family protein [Flavobacteriales bacterium]|nr:CotH kinase family protein [Flavobacteriales bacterium]
MRYAALVLVLLSADVHSQAPAPRESSDHILINEVLPSNRVGSTDSTGRSPDWIELFNPTNRIADLQGWRIAMAGRQHVFVQALVVPAMGHVLLWCDGRTERGSEHVSFKLPHEGGAVLLIEPDGATIADVFSYHALPANVSIGRSPDGARAWSYFTAPTPGAANASYLAVRARCEQPTASIPTGHYEGSQRIALSTSTGCRIRYTLDGGDPASAVALDYLAPVSIDASTALRAVAVADDRMHSEPLVGTYIIGSAHGESLALTVAPADLWSDSTGINTVGHFNNNTRSGSAWERDGLFALFGGSPVAARVSIHGSGSRGLRKRSFKLRAREEAPFTFADGTRSDELILRADASPHAWLRNATMEALVRAHALEVDVQPSRSASLYLNAAYWGVYRWMPSKDATWLKQRAGAEAVDVLEGPAAVPVRGSDAHYRRALALLERGAPIDSIDALIDTRSLIDLACIDLWTGRADHELNMRCYRPRQPGGRWRWVLFDMDLWSTPEENAVERMCSAVALETPFVPQLLAHDTLRARLLARITALQATAFGRAGTVADSLFRAHREELMADYKRWELELGSPHPDSTLAQLKHFAEQRPAQLFAHLARRTGIGTRTVIIEVPPRDQALVLLEGMPLAPGRQSVQGFTGIAVRLEVRAAEGHEFAGWKGLDLGANTGNVDFSKIRSIRPLLRALVP